MLGSVYDFHGDLPRSEQIWKSALDAAERHPGANAESESANLRNLLGQNLTKQRKYGEAEPPLRQALAFEEKRNANDWRRASARYTDAHK